MHNDSAQVGVVRAQQASAEGVGGRGRELHFRHRGQAVALFDATEHIALVVEDGGVEFGLKHAAVEREGQIVGGVSGDFPLRAQGVRFFHVKGDTRGAGARVQRHLQVVYLRVEDRGVELHAPGLRFEAQFVVPQGFVVVGLEGAELFEVAPGAQGGVQRVVDTAEAKALRHLRVDAHRVAERVAGHKARVETVGCGVVRLPVGIGEHAPRGEAARFLEVVPATAKGQIQAFAGGPGQLAEHGELFDVVGYVRVVRRIGAEAVGRTGRGCGAEHRVHGGIVSGGRQALRVTALQIRVERAGHPVHAPLAAGGDTQLVGDLFQFGGVAQIGGQQHRRGGQAQIHGHGTG